MGALMNLEPIFQSVKTSCSPPSLEATPRRSALKSKGRCSSSGGAHEAYATPDASPYGDEEAEMSSDSRPLRKKSATWSTRLEEVYPVFHTTYRPPRARCWEWNVCSITWAVVSSGFLMIFLVILFLDEPVL